MQLRTVVMLLIIFCAPVLISVYLYKPKIIDPVPYKISAVKAYPTGVKVTDKLSNIDFIDVKPFTGPESIVCNDGAIYTGVSQGVIVKINGSDVQSLSEPRIHGELISRPLGMRRFNDTHLVTTFTDGIDIVSTIDGSRDRIFPKDESFISRFLDDFDFISTNSLIVSEVSSDRPVEKAYLEYLEAKPTGRLLQIDLETGKWWTIAKGFYFANGVQLHRDRKSVLVAETTTSRILRIPLDGGPKEVFADGLPGHPDNIRISPRGGYWVPVSNLRSSFFSSLMDWASNYPIVRVVFAKVLDIPFLHWLRFTTSSALLRLDEDGTVIEVHTDPKNVVKNVAEVCEQDGVLYTGSYFLPFIGRLKL